MKRLFVLGLLLPFLVHAQSLRLTEGSTDSVMRVWAVDNSVIESVELKDGRLIVSVRYDSMAVYAVACGPQNPGCAQIPPTRERHIYGVKDGQIVLEQRQRERRVIKHEESVTWEEVK